MSGDAKAGNSELYIDGGSVTCNGDIFYTVNTPYGHTHPTQPYSITNQGAEPFSNKVQSLFLSFSYQHKKDILLSKKILTLMTGL